MTSRWGCCIKVSRVGLVPESLSELEVGRRSSGADKIIAQWLDETCACRGGIDGIDHVIAGGHAIIRIARRTILRGGIQAAQINGSNVLVGFVNARARQVATVCGFLQDGIHDFGLGVAEFKEAIWPLSGT